MIFMMSISHKFTQNRPQSGKLYPIGHRIKLEGTRKMQPLFRPEIVSQGESIKSWKMTKWFGYQHICQNK